MGINFVVWTLVLVCLEQGFSKKVKKFRVVCNKRRMAWPKPSL